jgi:ribosome-associated protein
LEKVVDASGTRIVGTESPQGSGWTVVDLFDVMVHLFLPEMRRRYRLEHLWREAPEIPVPGLLGEVEKPAAKPARKKRAPAKKKPAARKVAARKPSAKRKPAAGKARRK